MDRDEAHLNGEPVAPAGGPEPGGGLRASQVASGLAWSSMATLLGLVSQFAVMAVLARLLSPAVFGQFALAAVATRFVSGFAMAGAGQALVQRTDLSPGHATAALVMTLAASLALYAALLAASPAVAWLFGSGELVVVLAGLGLSIPLSSLASLPVALLRRQGRFKAAGGIDVAGYALGYGATAIVMAWSGWGVWSLVGAVLAQHLLVIVLGFWRARYPMSWPPARGEWWQMLTSGGRFTLIGFLEFLWSNIETMAIGRGLGPAAVGLFSRALALASLPVEQAVNAGTKVVFPAFSSWQHDKERVARGFIAALMVSGLLSTVLAAGIAGAAHDLVAALLGPKWRDAEPIVVLIAVGVPATFVYVACGVSLDSVGALRPKMLLQTTLLGLKFGWLMLALPAGLVAVVGVLVACEILRAVAGLWLAARVLGVRPSRLAGIAGVLLGIGAGVHLAVAAAQAAAVAVGAPLALRLALEAAAGAAAAGLTLALAIRAGTDFTPLRAWSRQIAARAWPRFRGDGREGRP